VNNKIYRLNLGGELLAHPDFLDGSYNSVNAMLEANKVPAIVLIDGLTPEDDNVVKAMFNAVCQLRRSEIFYAAPIYLTKSMGKLDVFTDGVGITKEEVLPNASKIIFRMEKLSMATNAVNDDLRLLTFLYCREDGYALSPLALTVSPWIYEYPAAFFIGGFAEQSMQSAYHFGLVSDKYPSKTPLQSSAEWVSSLAAQGFLVEAGLVDRIRLCPHCHTGSMNYIDSCPACGNIDFSKKKMIHCFTCAHVAAEEDFRNGMLLMCPRCNVTLRHIGSDYDRPVEAYSCNSCGERFIEPEVKADCLNCRRKSATEDLEVRQLYNLAITAKGKRAVQLGVIDVEFSLFDSNHNVLPLYFYQVADWLLQMKNRYSDEDFSLLCIKIVGLEAVENRAGMAQFKNLIDELGQRIRELVRVTDITTSTGENTFWVLLPRTPQVGGEILASRIEKLSDMVSPEAGARINMYVKCFSISAEYAGSGPVAQGLLSEYEDTMLDVR